MAIVLQETLRGAFYAPFYAALALGAYREEGVEVRLVSAPRPSESARGLADGTVDVTWGGPMRVMHTYEQDPGCDLVCFCEVVTRDPFFLIGGAANPGFSLADLTDKRVATVSEVPTPWLCLQEDMRRAGLDPARLDRVTGQSMDRQRGGAAPRRGRCGAAVPAVRRGAGRERAPDTSGLLPPRAAPPPTRRCMRAAPCWPSVATSASGWCAPSIAR